MLADNHSTEGDRIEDRTEAEDDVARLDMLVWKDL